MVLTSVRRMVPSSVMSIISSSSRPTRRMAQVRLSVPQASVVGAIVRELTVELRPEALQSSGVSVADAHLGATVRVLAHDEIVVLTSAPGDVVRVAGDRPVRAIQV
jgi:hypothetical protein